MYTPDSRGSLAVSLLLIGHCQSERRIDNKKGAFQTQQPLSGELPKKLFEVTGIFILVPDAIDPPQAAYGMRD